MAILAQGVAEIAALSFLAQRYGFFNVPLGALAFATLPWEQRPTRQIGYLRAPGRYEALGPFQRSLGSFGGCNSPLGAATYETGWVPTRLGAV